jgi:hypothetical protein
MRKLLNLLLLFVATGLAFGQGAQRTPSAQAWVNYGGYVRVLSGATITVCPSNGSAQNCNPTGILLYSDVGLTRQIPNPTHADANGNFTYYITPGTYGELVCSAAAVNCAFNLITLGAGGGGSGNTTSTALSNNFLPKANGPNSIINSSVSDNGTVSTTENMSVGTPLPTASIGWITTTSTSSIGTTSGDSTGTGLLFPPALGGGNYIATANTVSGVSTVLAQKFFGTDPPSSVVGNLPGDFYFATNYNDYRCDAASGTVAPACTAVAAGNWTLLGGGSGGGVSISGSPVGKQVAVWANGTSITGIGPGSIGQVLTSNGPGVNPSYQSTGGVTGGGFPVGSIQYVIWSNGIAANGVTYIAQRAMSMGIAPPSGSGTFSQISTPSQSALSFSGFLLSAVTGYGSTRCLNSSGSAAGYLTKLDGASGCEKLATTDTNIPSYIAINGPASDSTVELATIPYEIVSCFFDNATTAGHYVIASVSVAGECSDSGVAVGSAPPTGVWIVGVVTNQGVAVINQFGPNAPTALTTYHTSTVYTLTGADAGTAVATITIDTPSGNQWYDVGVHIVQSNTPASCMSGAASFAAQLDYTDATNSVHVTGLNNMALWNETSGNVGGAVGALVSPSTSAPTSGQMWDGVPRNVFVTASTPLKMILYMQTDNLVGCSPFPQVTITPVVIKIP